MTTPSKAKVKPSPTPGDGPSPSADPDQPKADTAAVTPKATSSGKLTIPPVLTWTLVTVGAWLVYVSIRGLSPLAEVKAALTGSPSPGPGGKAGVVTTAQVASATIAPVAGETNLYTVNGIPGWTIQADLNPDTGVARSPSWLVNTPGGSTKQPDKATAVAFVLYHHTDDPKALADAFQVAAAGGTSASGTATLARQVTAQPLAPDATQQQRAAVAVAAAHSQLGVPYQYAKSIPGTAFDCSGLTSYCWKQAGVNLIAQSSLQYASIPHVPTTSQALPGDLLFFHSPISHVSIYIGDGQMIHAPSAGHVVTIAPVNWANVVGVGRPGGK